MAAGEVIYVCRSFKHPTIAVAGVEYARITPSTTVKADRGSAGATGRAGSAITDKGVTVEVYGTNFAALIALLGQSANAVIGSEGEDGALEQHTVKNVKFTESISAVEIPSKDSGGKLAPFGIRGIGLWASSDTFATMIAAGAGS